MSNPFLRSKQVYQTSGTTATATFDETTPLDTSCLLVATVEVSNSTVVSAPSGWTTISGGGANGSSSQVRMFVKQGDSSTNSITVTVASSQVTLTLMAFSGFVSLTPLDTTGSTTASGTAYTWSAIAANTYTQAYLVIDSIGVSNTVAWLGSDINSVYASTGGSSIANSSQRGYTAYNWSAAGGAMSSQSVGWTTSRTGYIMRAVLPLAINPNPGVPYIASAGSPVSATSTSTLSVPVPGGVLVGDLIIMGLGAEWNSTTLPTTGSVSVAGFTVAQVAAFQSYTNYSENNFLLYKYATAADMGTYSVTFNTVGGGSVTQVAGFAAIIRGGPTSGNPFSDSFHSSHSVGSTSVSVATFTPSGDNNLIIGSVWCDDTVAVTTYPSGWTNQANTTSGNGMMLSTLQQFTGAATGALSWGMASGSPDPVVLIGTIRGPFVPYTPPSAHIVLNFDEGSGAIAHDSSGNANDFTLADTSRWTTSGKNGGGFAYGNGTGYAYRGLTADIATANLPFTVMMWVNPANTTQSDSGLIGNTALDLEYASGTFYGDGFGSTPATYPASTWTHVAWVADGTNRITYVNGVNVLSVAGNPPGGWANTNYIGVGGTEDTNNFEGVIDDLRVFKSALTVTDINYFMNLSASAAAAQWYLKTVSSLVPLSPYLLTSGGLTALGVGALYTAPVTAYNFPSSTGITVGTVNNDGAAGGGLALGEIITPLQSGLTATGVRWWADATAAGMHAIGRLWDAGSGSVLAEAPLKTLTTGWNVLSFTIPYSLVSGDQVIAGVFLASGEAIYTQTTTGSVARSTAQFSIASSGSRYEYSASAALSASDGGNDTWYGIDIIATSS